MGQIAGEGEECACAAKFGRSTIELPGRSVEENNSYLFPAGDMTNSRRGTKFSCDSHKASRLPSSLRSCTMHSSLTNAAVTYFAPSQWFWCSGEAEYTMMHRLVWGWTLGAKAVSSCGHVFVPQFSLSSRTTIFPFLVRRHHWA